ncbi:hypothetical protein [Helicobacter pylori]|nr:hypothetical protein [Helicobacter pylori]MDU9700723.1 hypothetical protein [Helicobacter pylori]
MRLVVFFNGFNLWLLRGYYYKQRYKHESHDNRAVCARYKKT